MQSYVFHLLSQVLANINDTHDQQTMPLFQLFKLLFEEMSEGVSKMQCMGWVCLWTREDEEQRARRPD